MTLRSTPLACVLVIAAGCSKTSSTTPPAPRVPQITSDFWTIAHNPDLGDLAGPASDGSFQQVVDFGIWQAADGSWELWACIRGTAEPGQHRLFYSWESASLTSPDWTPKGIAMRADTTLGEVAGGLQAPYVLRVGDTWHMFYGDWEHICHATSTDGKTFTRVVTNGTTTVFTEPPPPNAPAGVDAAFAINTRDPMVLPDNGLYRIYYSAEATYDAATNAFQDHDYMRTSTDLTTWSDPVEVAYAGKAGTGVSSAECPFVVHDGADYFLFRTQHYGTDMQTSVYRSPKADNFGINDDSYLVEQVMLAAPEVAQQNGQYYVARVRADYQGIEVAKMAIAAAP